MKKTVLEKSVVAVSKVKNSIFKSISRAMDLADCTTYLKENQNIALKINLGWDMFIPGSITSPMVTEGVVGVIKEYWDFFDHITPLSDRSLMEILESLDMKIITCYPKFLPYTTRSGFPKGTLFIKINVRLPILWKIFGKQAFIIAKKHPQGDLL